MVVLRTTTSPRAAETAKISRGVTTGFEHKDLNGSVPTAMLYAGQRRNRSSTYYLHWTGGSRQRAPRVDREVDGGGQIIQVRAGPDQSREDEVLLEAAGHEARRQG